MLCVVHINKYSQDTFIGKERSEEDRGKRGREREKNCEERLCHTYTFSRRRVVFYVVPCKHILTISFRFGDFRHNYTYY
jgi:hypothetical protein